MRSTVARAIGLAFLAAIIAACELGGESTFRRAAPDDDDDDAFTIVSTSPASGAVAVDLAAPITVTFSESLDPLSVNSASLQVRNGSLDIEGVISVVSDSLTFDPDAELHYLSTLDATVVGVASETGMSLPTSHVWSFTTRDLAWGDPEFLSVDPAPMPEMAITPDGIIFLAWIEDDNGWIARFDTRSGWNLKLLEEGANPVSLLRVAVDPQGNAITAWKQDSQILWTRRYDAGTGWEAPIDLPIPKIPKSVDVACATGFASLIWAEGAGGIGDLVSARTFEPSTGWSTATVFASDITASGSQLACSESGSCVAAWQRTDTGAGAGTWINRLVTVGSGWEGPVLQEQGDVGIPSSPSIAMDDGGGAIVGWTGGGSKVWVNVFDSQSGWEGAAAIEDSVAPTELQIALAPSGDRGVAIWSQSDGVRRNIVATQWTPSDGWTNSQTVDTENLGDAVNPRVALDKSGNGVATWIQFDGTRDNIFSSRLLNGIWLAPERVEMDDTTSATGASIGIDRAGRVTAIFRQSGAAWESRFR